MAQIDNQVVDLSIIIPVYQSGDLIRENLPVLKEYLDKLGGTTQILVVDDGSDDAEACKKTTQANGGIYLANSKNRGKGSAVRLGMLAASGRYRIFTDADLPYELEAIGEALALFSHPHDIIVGDRTLAESHYFERIPMLRKYTSVIFSLFVRSLVLKENYDTQCGFKAFTAEAAQGIFTRSRIDRFTADVEMLAIARLRKYAVARLPVRLRHWQESGISVVRDSLRMLYDLARIRIFLATGAYN